MKNSCVRYIDLIETFNKKTPSIDSTAYVHSTAVIIGDVTIKANCSVWPFAVIRGDVEPIFIDEGTNIQDHAMIHASSGYPVTVGKHVTIGHHAIIHGATIHDEVLVGMDSVVLDGSIIEKHCLIGAKALVTSHSKIKERSLVLGSPAKVICDLSLTQVKSILDNADEYIQLKEKAKEQ